MILTSGAYITDFSTTYSIALYRAPLSNILDPPHASPPWVMQDVSEARRGHFTYLFTVYEGGEDMGFVWWRDVPEGGLAET